MLLDYDIDEKLCFNWKKLWLWILATLGSLIQNYSSIKDWKSNVPAGINIIRNNSVNGT